MTVRCSRLAASGINAAVARSERRLRGDYVGEHRAAPRYTDAGIVARGVDAEDEGRVHGSKVAREKRPRRAEVSCVPNAVRRKEFFYRSTLRFLRIRSKRRMRRVTAFVPDFLRVVSGLESGLPATLPVH